MSNKNKISVTIITLTYRDFSGLSKTIRSVLNQAFNEVGFVEYLVVDDGSEKFDKAKVLEVIDEVKSDCSSVNSILVYANEINLGTVKSFNKAIDRSTGDIIIPLSSGDEFFDVNSVDEIVKQFTEENITILTALRQVVDDSGVLCVEPSSYDTKLFDKGSEGRLLKRLVLRGNFISGACTYYSRNFLKGVGGFDEKYRLLEDYPMYLKALNSGYHISIIKNVLMKHKVGGVSDGNEPVNEFFCKDHDLVKLWIQENIYLDKMDKRLFKYFQLMSKRQRLSFFCILKYPDCLIIWIFYFLVSGFSRGGFTRRI
ncbi:MAG: glycosyltransferase [Oceanospirillales bacterium]|nr:glycosyltransferase [Oceanospirillales bacterium]MBR9889853.1 glycosyltransferase [Oceanospirillales bacterium]